MNGKTGLARAFAYSRIQRKCDETSGFVPRLLLGKEVAEVCPRNAELATLLPSTSIVDREHFERAIADIYHVVSLASPQTLLEVLRGPAPSIDLAKLCIARVYSLAQLEEPMKVTVLDIVTNGES
jgi:hypothetical protein